VFSTSPRRNSRRKAIKKNAEIAGSAALPQQRLGIDRLRHQAGRLRERTRTLFSSQYFKDPTDAAVEERSRAEGLERFPGQVFIPEVQPRRFALSGYAYNAAHGLVACA
jgi:hypothetical protein